MSRQKLDPEFGAVDTERLNNVHVVRSAADLDRLFPDVTDGTWSSESDLEDGDMVLFDGRDAPYRHDHDLRIESVSDIVIQGSAPVDLKPADGANAGKFVMTDNDGTPSNITFVDVGFDGNQQNMTGGETPMLLNWVAPNVRLIRCYAAHTYPYHVHNGGGTAVRIKQNGTGFRAYNCYFDNVGDRAIQCVNTEDIIISGCRATNGYDRMIHFTGVRHATVANCTSVDTVEGSAYGVNEGYRESRDLVFVGNHGRGAMRNLFSFEAIDGNGISRVFCLGNTKEADPNAGGTANYRNIVHQEGGTSGSQHHYYLMNGSAVDAEAAFEIRFDNTVVDYNFSLDCEWLIDHQDGDDCRFGANNWVGNARTSFFRESGGVRARYGGYASTSNTNNTPGGGFFMPGEWSEHTNTSDSSVRHLVRLPPHASGTWYEPATDTVDP